MRGRYTLFLPVLILLSLSGSGGGLGGRLRPQAVIRVTDFGIKPDSRENAVPAVVKALQACRGLKNPVLVFPEGRYDFWPVPELQKDYFESNTTDNNPKRLAVFIESFAGLTVDGGGSSLIFHDRIQPFTVDRSSDVTIRNLSIDWEVPLSAEAVVAAAGEESIDLRIDPARYPHLIEGGKLVFVGEGWKSAWWGTMEFDGETLRVVPGTGDAGCLGRGWNDYRAEELEPGLVRLNRRFGRLPKPGNVLVLRHSERDHAGLFLADSRNVTVEKVDLYHCAGLGLLAQFCENVTLRESNVVPSPTRKALSGHDDGAHFSNCRGLVRIEKCRFHGLMDDPVNVHGTSVRLIAKPAPDRLVARFMHDQSTGMHWGRPGDKVGFIENDSMRTMGDGVCASWEARDRDTFEIRFAAPVPAGIEPGDALENLTWSPDVEIRGCRFDSNRARGVLVSTPGRVVIEDNRFESSGSAILIAGDANQWYESGAVRDVTIRRNLFAAPCLTSMYQFCEGIISVFPEIPKPDPAFPFHRSIRIEGNEFYPFDYPVLYAKSVDGLTFSGNRLVRSRAFAPFHARKATVTLDSCCNVRIEGNTFEGDVLGKNIVLTGTAASEVTIGPGQGWIR
ncbi:MAG: right-handed parallel beta-helix repeat-containing protein [Candidatus Aminicenantes bacterium]|nr:right-handed parallel beta-helix repeat-containing protein [Candidatus Aminicenantes bacterium]